MKKLRSSNKSSPQQSSEDEKLQEQKERANQNQPEKEESSSGTPINIGIQSPSGSAFRSTFDEPNEEVPWWKKVLKYMNHSSLFLLPDNSKFRERLLTIVATPEDIILQSKAQAAPDMYGIADIEKSQVFNQIHINEGKILIRDKNKFKAKFFEIFIVVVILLSCIMLCIDTPLNDPDSTFSGILAVIDIIFSIVFLIEAILKILAFGFFWNHYQGVGAYILNAWNVLDFIVVIMSLVDIYFSYIVAGSSSDAENLSSFKALRAIRALRPLRMISRNEGLKIAIQALLASIPAIGNVLII